jgi:hypothetical protein
VILQKEERKGKESKTKQNVKPLRLWRAKLQPNKDDKNLFEAGVHTVTKMGLHYVG